METLHETGMNPHELIAHRIRGGNLLTGEDITITWFEEDCGILYDRGHTHEEILPAMQKRWPHCRIGPKRVKAAIDSLYIKAGLRLEQTKEEIEKKKQRQERANARHLGKWMGRHKITRWDDGLLVRGSNRTDPMPVAHFRLTHLNDLNIPLKAQKIAY